MHDLGLVRFVIEPVWRRLPCHLVRPAVRTIGEWLTTISEVRGTWTAEARISPTGWRRGLVDPATVDLSSLRVALSGGEPVRASSIDAFERRFSTPGLIRPGYGLGEATLGVLGDAPASSRQGRRSRQCRVRPTPARRRGPRRRFAARPGGDPRPWGGCVCRLLRRARRTPPTGILRDGWLHTGDTGYLDSEGRLFVLGRRRGMIKRGGALIAPRELVEEVAQRVEGVRIAAAASVEHPEQERERGETIVIAVEVESSTSRAEDAIAGAVSREIVAALRLRARAKTRIVHAADDPANRERQAEARAAGGACSPPASDIDRSSRGTGLRRRRGFRRHGALVEAVDVVVLAEALADAVDVVGAWRSSVLRGEAALHRGALGQDAGNRASGAKASDGPRLERRDPLERASLRRAPDDDRHRGRPPGPGDSRGVDVVGHRRRQRPRRPCPSRREAERHWTPTPSGSDPGERVLIVAPHRYASLDRRSADSALRAA